MSFKYDREDIREAALKRQQKRLGHHGHGGFVHRDSSDLLPIDDLKKMGTVSKETQPKAIVQQKALKETFKRSDSKEQPGQRNRSMSQDATGTDALTVPSRPRTGRRHHSCSDYDNSDSRLGGDNTLLFIKCKCNDHEVKAVVDTGNIFSVMSEETATTCGLKRLIDTEANGTVSAPDRAKKQWTVIGRLGRVPLAVGSRHAEANFIVTEERGTDLTFGLDILRKLKATVDLEQNTLVLGGEPVPFLQGREIPLKHRWGDVLSHRHVGCHPRRNQNGTVL